jgi:sulfatase modifying factor 1
MTQRVLRSRFQRVPHVIAALSGLLLIASGCEKLVGITDTEVTNDGTAGGDATAGADTSGAGKSSMSSAGSHAGGSESAGAPSGGDAGSPGTETGGTTNSAGSSGAPGGAGKSGSGTGGSSGASNNGGSGGAASECPCTAPTPTCENNKCVVRGPDMIQVTDSATPYYIDSTEVTSAEYKIFQTAKGTDYTGQRAACAWNKSYAASEVNTHANWPVVNIDFCDAAAYCAWADKRLCGAIGGGALKGTDPDIDMMPDTTNVMKSQWYLACGGPNGDEFPYATYEKDGYCNEQDGFGDLADVKSYTNCQGHYEGLYDMVGNVEEWIDSCDADAANTDHCAVIGGSEYSNSDGGCEIYDLEQRDAQYPGIGFRCCSK